MLGARQDTVEFVPYNPSWRYLFQLEVITLRRSLGIPDLIVEHVGSTAIPDISATPVLDMLISIDSLNAVEDINEAFATAGYRRVHDDLDNISFVKEKADIITHHLTIACPNSSFWQEAIEFRDRMLKHPEWAQCYDFEKTKLASLFPSERENYISTRAKFIETVLVSSDNSLAMIGGQISGFLVPDITFGVI